MDEIVGLAGGLGAAEVAGSEAAADALRGRCAAMPAPLVEAARRAITAGRDPLGEAFSRLRGPALRRGMGATYTPPSLVAEMVALSEEGTAPARVVDPGAGSARFLVAAGRRFPDASLIAAEADPVAAWLACGHLAAAGLAPRAQVRLGDFRQLELPRERGVTLFLGNPPYVRHHEIEPRWKRWLVARAKAFGLRASRLAGLHMHFLVAIAEQAQPRDRGVLVTSAEWLDTRYGALARGLLLETLGLRALDLLEPTTRLFEDAQSTGVVIRFQKEDSDAPVVLRRHARPEQLGSPNPGRRVGRLELAAASRWTPLSRKPRSHPVGWVQLGEWVRVHRGQATGANAVWLAGGCDGRLPTRFQVACVTKARELFQAGAALASDGQLKRVLDLPAELDVLAADERRWVDRFLRAARRRGVASGFIARHRRAWWAVGLRPPAPILATYMARRPPAFVLNTVCARNLNVAHGLYPRAPTAAAVLEALAAHLAAGVSTEEGRTYAGGLTKFEPSEMERLWVPGPELLATPA